MNKIESLSDVINEISDDNISKIISLMQQDREVLFLNDVFDFLSKEILISKLMQEDVIKCSFCSNMRIGISDLATHIHTKHPVKGIYYEDIQIIPSSLDNIDPSHPPSRLYLCAYCGFPTTNAFGSNPTSEMLNHIDYHCKKAPPVPKQIKMMCTEDEEVIKKYLSEKNFIDAKICKKCDDIFGKEELVITHYLEKHCPFDRCATDEIKNIFNHPQASLSDNLDVFYNLNKKNEEIINQNKPLVTSFIMKKLSARKELVCFSDSWLLNGRLLGVDLNKIAVELEKYPSGLSTSSLVDLVFNSSNPDNLPVQKFSLCYALQQSGNFFYDFEQDIWKFKSEVIDDSPGEDEILISKRSPTPRVRSKIDLEDEEMFPDSTERIYKEFDMITWERVKKDEIHYLLFFTYIYNSFLPYDENARKLFPPNVKRVYFISDFGKKFSVKISRANRSVYSREFRNIFQDIPAGTIVYIRRLNSNRDYKIYFNKKPQKVKDCRIARYDEIKKEVVYETQDIDVLYECVPPIFKAELRFRDLKALWEEARLSGYSIADLVYLEFKKLAETKLDQIVHFNEIYSRVFFRRMCSPGGVWSILKRHPTYYKYEGNKLWRFVGTIGENEIEVKVIKKKKYTKTIYVLITAIIILLCILFLKR